MRIETSQDYTSGAEAVKAPSRGSTMKLRRISDTVEEGRKSAMEVRFTADLEKKLNELSAQSGRPADELVQDAVAGMFDELAETREMLDRRYDDIKSGRVKLIPGDEVEGYFREKSAAARRAPQPGS
jgi:predicted DNA-binding protein